MARTKQTARKSNGGRMSYSGGSQTDQIDILKATGKKTIVVEGTSEFYETPDMIHLSFLIEKKARSLQEGIKKVISTLADVRAIATSCGVANSDISSDSIGSQVEHTEYGHYENVKREPQHGQNFKRTDFRVTHKVRSVLRICLEGEEAPTLFSKVCFAIISAGIRTQDAPVYESTKLTELRNQARQEACENAKEKAKYIVDALGDATVKLGPPIALTDVHCNLQDDSDDSFLGNFDPTSYSNPKRVCGKPEDVDESEDEYEFVPKKARKDGATDHDKMDATSTPLDASIADQIFVVPPIKIAACVKAIFEISTTEQA